METLLRARDKYLDLVDLYNGKKMHHEALELLKEFVYRSFSLPWEI